MTAGVIDLRRRPLSPEEERDTALARELASRSTLDFEGLVRILWSGHPEVPERLVERFVRNDVIGPGRAAVVAEQIESLIGGPDSLRDTSVLEVGAGSAALGDAMVEKARHVVVSDVSLAWLVAANRRLAHRQAADADAAKVTVVACAGEDLPYADGTFDVVVGADVIEHVGDAQSFVNSCCRVLRPGGHLWLATPNRLSLTPEPHVRLWGVGLLPRPLALAYVRAARGVDYREIRTLSVIGLRRVLSSTGGAVRIVAPSISVPVREGYHPAARALIDVYNALTRTPVVRRAVVGFAPLFHAVLTKAG